MANVVVEDVDARVVGGNRCVVRTSGDRVYVVTSNNESGSIQLRVHKGNQNGEPTSFTPERIVTIGQMQNVGCACAIDSGDIIHIILLAYGTGMTDLQEIRYFSYDTSIDNFIVQNEQVQAFVDGDGDGSWNRIFAICVDANDDPHVAYNDEAKDMGVGKETVFYTNKIGGSWNTKVQILQTSGAAAPVFGLDIMITQPTNAIGADRPIICINADLQMDVFHGTALNATAFTAATDVTNPDVRPITRPISMVVVQNNDIYICYTDNGGQTGLRLAKHLATQATWATWESTVQINGLIDYRASSLSADINFLYAYAEASSSNDIELWKRVNGSFVEETGDADLPNAGTFNDVKTKWGSKFNNSPRELDYVFEDNNGDVLYNTFQGEAPPVGAPDAEFVEVIA